MWFTSPCGGRFEAWEEGVRSRQCLAQEIPRMKSQTLGILERPPTKGNCHREGVWDSGQGLVHYEKGWGPGKGPRL